ncbi:UPF0042 nucleotide-binding protein [Streptomyces sp. Amel2xB2]|uniref:RapZ C-terminal domain-containing protein n=1 Tax=Streptomyces sp. Amel2xB2 TaxID=1305829 RepID=UPI000DBFBC5D|nr:RNase adapter RapZ [Streptomyces sp. Amel2xB2]RAJ70247.1 UPF0042 nucleotide-binding protein [Streptomyces sp. Amel2xB2]
MAGDREIRDEARLMADVSVTSFGFLHDAPPEAHLLLDVRQHFRDPHVNPELRELTANDAPVQDAVMSTHGIPELIGATVVAARAFLDGPSTGTVRIAVGCAGGRHRAPVVASAVAERLTEPRLRIALRHRDMALPVVERGDGS